jgi:hypothetical protein
MERRKHISLVGKQKVDLITWLQKNQQSCETLTAPQLVEQASEALGFPISAPSLNRWRGMVYPNLVVRKKPAADWKASIENRLAVLENRLGLFVR